MPMRRLWAGLTATVLLGTAVLGDDSTSLSQADRMSTADTKSGKSLGSNVRQTARRTNRQTTHPTLARLLELHNQTRARVGLSPLTLNQQMCAAAQQHANWMASTGSFTHSRLPYRENIAYGQTSPDQAVRSWTTSPGHYQNMCSGRQAGFGYQVRGGVGYWVAVFR